MSRASPRRALAFALLVWGVLAIGVAHAEGERDPRARLAAQLADQAAVIETTRTTITEKIGALDKVRLARMRAAYRVLRTPLPSDATSADRMAAARKRAGARLLVERDLDERGLLVDELAMLAKANERTVVATQAVPNISLPPELAWPAAGTIARQFGTISHEKSKTTLARRGIDIEVEAKTPAKASAAGTVRYAGPIRGLDLGVIIDHGDYMTVVAKLGELAVPTGAKVVAGDQVGRAARHRIYLELRAKISAGGLPIDPEPLLVGESESRDEPAATSKKSR
ncbi:MAG: murein hydrolase activator EnvC [Kofleriaceae bacterium]